MGLIENSKDLLNVVIAFSVLWLTIFVAWFIYYLAMMAKQFYQIVKEMRERFKKIDEAIDALRQKIEHSVSYLSLIGEGVKKLVETIKEYGDKKEEKRKKK